MGGNLDCMGFGKLETGELRQDTQLDKTPDEYTKKIVDEETPQVSPLHTGGNHQRIYKNGSVIICTY